MSDPNEALNSYPTHGGDLSFATGIYGAPEKGWLDLSTGINPVACPMPALPAEVHTRLPDPVALRELVAAARKAYRIVDGADVIAVPGTEMAIRLLPIVGGKGPVAIVGPTYGSHAEAWRGSGEPLVAVRDTTDVPAGTAIAVVTNPNNPDGRLAPVPDLTRLAARVRLLVVDEAFADLNPDGSIAPAMGGLPIVVLRSFGKFYGLPGLRLGFVAGPAELVESLAALLGDWPVSGAAIAVGTAALGDKKWQAQTRERLQADGLALRALLARHGLKIAGRTDLFALIDIDDAHGLHVRLARQGIWTRAFADQPGWLRLGVPTVDGLRRLEAALSAA